LLFTYPGLFKVKETAGMSDKDKGGKTGKKTAPLHPDETGEVDEINRYQEILARESSSLVFAALSEAYRKGNMLDQAIAVCKKGLHHHPGFVSGRVALARAYVDKGETDRAAKELEKVILAAPDNLIAQGLLLAIYEEKRDWDNLEKTVHRVLSVDPQDEKARKSWQTLRTQPTTDENAADGGSGEIVTQTLAEIYASQGYFDKAFDIYRKLSVREPENPNLHERLADLKQQSLHRSPRK
jgi:tetratricopeptide (TPR) repeat protein